jgi:hypothetical protein
VVSEPDGAKPIGRYEGDGDEEARGDVARVVGVPGEGASATAGADRGAGEPGAADGLADGEGSAAAEDAGAAELAVAVADAAAGECGVAAWWPPPSVTVSPMPVPVRASTAAKRATPERKLISSMRAFITRLRRSAQPVPSVTTKHDTWVSTVLVGSGGREAVVALFGQLAGWHYGFAIFV